MKLQYVSDIHLEWDQDIVIPNYDGSDALILAGDICVAEYFGRSEASPYHAKAKKFLEFFKSCSENFKDVIYIMGNHESYKGYIDKTVSILRENLKPFPNIHILDNEFIEINDIRFVGTTLWTNLNAGCPITESSLRGAMNDYKVIQWSHNYRKLTPMDTFKMHTEALDFIDKSIDHECVVVVGHHAPSTKSIHPKYASDRYINGGYSSSLENFIAYRPQIKAWFHGHTHDSFTYRICDTLIACNPKGYKNENPWFNPQLLIEVNENGSRQIEHGSGLSIG